MKWDLTKGEFEVVFQTTESLAFDHQWSPGIYNQILQSLITKLYIKLYAKAVYNKPRYKLTIEDELCLAFYEMTYRNKLPYDSYEGHVINRLNGNIDQKCLTITINNNQKQLR